MPAREPARASERREDTVRILVCPVDLTSVDEGAVAAAFALAASGGTVHLLSVQEIGYVLNPLDGTPILPALPSAEALAESERKARARLEALVPASAAARGVHAAVHVRVENGVAAAISRFAEEQHAEAIVLGTHGRKGIDRLLMGSVASEVLRHAKPRVIVIRSPKE
jgi:nucleotide-binding universal stress UspA family protein